MIDFCLRGWWLRDRWGHLVVELMLLMKHAERLNCFLRGGPLTRAFPTLVVAERLLVLTNDVPANTAIKRKCLRLQLSLCLWILSAQQQQCVCVCVCVCV